MSAGPHDWGYPIRGIVKNDMLYLRNFEPTRWPACNPETGYLNCDGGPTKTVVLDKVALILSSGRYWQLCFGKRASEELYDLKSDPDCLTNLAADSKHDQLKRELHEQMTCRAEAQEDPRMFGRGAHL